MIEENLETEEYTKELIAQTSASLVNTGSCTMEAVHIGARSRITIYYNAL